MLAPGLSAGQLAAGPGAAEERQVGGEQGVAVRGVEREGVKGGQVAAGANADFEPAAGHEVEHRGVLGDADRQLERQRDDAGGQPDARRPRRGLRQEHQRPRHPALVLMEMMLGHPGAVEAQPLGMHDLFERQAIPLGRRGLVEDAGEEAEAEGAGHAGGRSVGLLAVGCWRRPGLVFGPLVSDSERACRRKRNSFGRDWLVRLEGAANWQVSATSNER